MVKFVIYKNTDIEAASKFLDKGHVGIDYRRNIIKVHPQMKNVKCNKRAISNFVNRFYNLNKKSLKEVQKNFQQQWDSVEEEFVKKTVELFEGFNFPESKYFAFISAFNYKNPRILEDCSFLMFYKTVDCRITTSHELMHFIFYAFTKIVMKELVDNLDPNRGLWWDTAEILNSVVLSSEKFKRVFKSDHKFCYPEHELLLPRAKRMFQDSNNIQDFIRNLFNYIKSVRYPK